VAASDPKDKEIVIHLIMNMACRGEGLTATMARATRPVNTGLNLPHYSGQIDSAIKIFRSASSIVA